jgi:F0F1-type ATP synthase membrane subunit b/b'
MIEGVVQDPSLLADSSFWAGAAFVALLVLMFGLKGKTLLGLLDARVAGVQAQFDRAEQQKIAAQAALTEMVAMHRQIFERGAAIRQHAEEEAARRLADVEHQIAEITRYREQQLLLQIEVAKADALQVLRVGLVEQALDVCRHYLQHQLGSAEQVKLVEAAVLEFSQIKHEVRALPLSKAA